MKKKTLATVWLDGCSGCHMSFLDMDERLLELLSQVNLVYSPLVDNKIFPDNVDITLVEGSVSTDEDLHKIKTIREKTKTLVSLGDCAVTANVPSMRNPLSVGAILERVSDGSAIRQPTDVPLLKANALPVHNYVKVDVFIPGCPPSADVIHTVLLDLLANKKTDISKITRFGA